MRGPEGIAPGDRNGVPGKLPGDAEQPGKVVEAEIRQIWDSVEKAFGVSIELSSTVYHHRAPGGKIPLSYGENTILPWFKNIQAVLNECAKVQDEIHDEAMKEGVPTLRVTPRELLLGTVISSPTTADVISKNFAPEKGASAEVIIDSLAGQVAPSTVFKGVKALLGASRETAQSVAYGQVEKKQLFIPLDAKPVEIRAVFKEYVGSLILAATTQGIKRAALK